MWIFLLASFVAYVVYIGLNAVEMRKNPPVQILRKNEPFKLPDVVVCVSAGDGCNGNNGSACLPMNWSLSSYEGLSDDCDKYFATPSTPVLSTPAPSSDSMDFFAGVVEQNDSVAAPTPSPIALISIRYNLETTAHEWCPRVPLSECAIDYEGVDAGYVRAIYASFYVLWKDTVSSEDSAVNSTRRFVNMFFVDEDTEVTDAVVAVRLPYDRVSIHGTDPFTFSSNDVILTMSQYVHLGSAGGGTGRVERTFTQATTTARHTLAIADFEGRQYEGALLYVTLSVNNFAYQSIEEIDPVDWWALLGSAGGVWEIICVVFGACFVARHAIGPDKKWNWASPAGKGRGGRCSCCQKRDE
eukprot:g4844.t1